MQKQAWICTSLVSALWFICTTSQTNKCTAKVQPLRKVSLSLRMQREPFFGCLRGACEPYWHFDAEWSDNCTSQSLHVSAALNVAQRPLVCIWATVPIGGGVALQHWTFNSVATFPQNARTWGILQGYRRHDSEMQNHAFLLLRDNTQAASSPIVGRVMCNDHQPVSARAFQN